jgi:hypothetical protein
LKLGAPVPLFALGDDTRLVDFEMSPDGQRFLATLAESLATEQPYTVLVNGLVAHGGESGIVRNPRPRQ